MIAKKPATAEPEWLFYSLMVKTCSTHMPMVADQASPHRPAFGPPGPQQRLARAQLPLHFLRGSLRALLLRAGYSPDGAAFVLALSGSLGGILPETKSLLQLSGECFRFQDRRRFRRFVVDRERVAPYQSVDQWID